MNPQDYAFTANFTPVALAGAAARQKSTLRSNLLVAVVLGLVILGLQLAGQLTPNVRSWLLWFLGFSVLYVVVSAVRLWRANRLLAKLGRGVALTIDPAGIAFTVTDQTRWMAWSQIVGVGAKNQQFLPGPELVVSGHTKAEQWRIPFSYLDVMPGSIDSAVRAATGGRMQLDLHNLDRIW